MKYFEEFLEPGEEVVGHALVALERVALDHVTLAVEDSEETVLAIHEALERLTTVDPLKAEVVKLRYFIGLSHAEIAQVLAVSEATVRRHWAFARSWLYAELKAQR